MKVRENAQYLPPHILMSEAKWAEVFDTNPIGMWFGTNKNDSSLIRVIKFYWKSQAPAVLTKEFVIDYQELLFKQNAPRGKLKILYGQSGLPKESSLKSMVPWGKRKSGCSQ